MSLDSMEHLDTPSLILDLDKMENNLLDIASYSKKHHIQWRPHIKTHKCIKIAKRQIAMGACGLTVAKLSEAEIMAKAGIKDILIAFPLSSPQKLERLRLLLDCTDVKVAVDSIEQAEIMHKYFLENKISKPLVVWIKVNSGLNRCGVEPGNEVLQLAKSISTMPTLSLKGIFTHAGHSYAATSTQQIADIATNEGKTVAESAALCEKEGIKIEVRSVGSTPTYKTAGVVPGITEVRPGNAVFFDAIQAGLGVTTIDQCAVTVLASVASIKSNRLIIDAGSKTLSLDQGAHGNASVKGFGHIIGHPELIIERLSEEHGIVTFNKTPSLKLGDKIQIIPNHACTVINLFNHIFVQRNMKIIDRWTIDARGCNQ